MSRICASKGLNAAEPHSTYPSILALPLLLDRPGMMRVHQDATPRIFHRSTHLDDALWAFAPSFRSTEHQALFDLERWGSAGRSPFGSWASPCRRHACAPAQPGVGGHEGLA